MSSHRDKTPFAVIRRAVLMEDQGIERVVARFAVEADANKWVDDQKGEYHPPSDYYVEEQG